MEYVDALGVLAVAVLVVVAAYTVHLAVTVDADPLRALPFASGGVPDEHAWSRFHARWYVASLVFLAFDIEMLFMYPWAAVLPQMTLDSLVEMFGFLFIILAGVVYAWREGAFRWS